MNLCIATCLVAFPVLQGILFPVSPGHSAGSALLPPSILNLTIPLMLPAWLLASPFCVKQ